MKKKHAALPQTPEAFAVVAKPSSKQQVSAVKLFKTPLKKKPAFQRHVWIPRLWIRVRRERGRSARLPDSSQRGEASPPRRRRSLMFPVIVALNGGGANAQPPHPTKKKSACDRPPTESSVLKTTKVL